MTWQTQATIAGAPRNLKDAKTLVILYQAFGLSSVKVEYQGAILAIAANCIALGLIVARTDSSPVIYALVYFAFSLFALFTMRPNFSTSGFRSPRSARIPALTPRRKSSVSYGVRIAHSPPRTAWGDAWLPAQATSWTPVPVYRYNTPA